MAKNNATRLSLAKLRHSQKAAWGELNGTALPSAVTWISKDRLVPPNGENSLHDLSKEFLCARRNGSIVVNSGLTKNTCLELARKWFIRRKETMLQFYLGNFPRLGSIRASGGEMSEAIGWLIDFDGDSVLGIFSDPHIIFCVDYDEGFGEYGYEFSHT